MMAAKGDKARTDARDEALSSDDALALDGQLCFAVYSAAHALTRTYKPLLDPYGLTYPQYIALLTLWDQDGRTVKALGAKLGLDSGTLSPLLKRLEASGYILRARDKGDERQVLITLTEKGRALKAKAAGIRLQIGVATGCQAEALATLTADLKAMTRGLEAAKADESVEQS